MRTLDLGRLVLLIGGAVGLVAACSAASATGGFGQGGSASGTTGAGATTGTTGTTATGAGNGAGGGISFDAGMVTSTGTGTGAGTACVVTDMNKDMDGDGWTPAQGDCNDCDPNVNPGAIDVAPVAGPDGGLGPEVDSNCDGKFDPPVPCDTGLALNDTSGADAAKAIELCLTTTTNPATPQERTWGVLSSTYVRADGTAYPGSGPGKQVGIQSSWGTNVHVQAGENMLVLSSGYARTSSQGGACGSNSCTDEGLFNTVNAPSGFPQNSGSCPIATDIYDDIGLQVDLRAPTNATGYSFSFKFYSFEFPFWVCDNYNDQFIALVSPAPAGALNGNISFDSKHNPVSVNLGFFTVCDPSEVGLFASDCNSNGGGCPPTPTPYCPAGVGDLAGTGFDIWDGAKYNGGMDYGGAGATSWLESQAPVKGGSIFSIRFAMWDTGDNQFDSTTLVDNFKWIATAGTVEVMTNPMQGPQ